MGASYSPYAGLLVNGRSFPVHETLIFVLPSPSARVVAYQVRVMYSCIMGGSLITDIMCSLLVVGQSGVVQRAEGASGRYGRRRYFVRYHQVCSDTSHHNEISLLYVNF